MKYSNYTKKQLIKVIEILEYNNQSLKITLDLQNQNYERLLKESEVKNG